MTSLLFYELEEQQLDILDSFLAHNSSRIISNEVLDHLIEIFLMLKR